MVRTGTVIAVIAVLASPGCAPADGPVDAPTAIVDAQTAMGMESLDSISMSGTARNLTNFQQSRSSTSPALVEVANYTRGIDLTRSVSRATGEMMVVGTFGGDPQPQAFNQLANPDSGWTQQMELWLTPWAFLRGAAENGATARREGEFTIITWMPASPTATSGLRYTVQGYINDANLVDRVETWVEDNIAGDMPVVATYSDYRDVDGVMVPGRVVQTRAALTYFEANLTDFAVNPTDIADLVTPPQPAGGRVGAPGGGRGGAGRGGAAGAGPEAPVELAEQLDEGVWRITGGYVSLAVEFADHVVVVEGPQSGARGTQILEEVRRVFPDKPIQYVVNTHPHSDHTGGLPAFVAAGVPILTHENNVQFLSRALANPRTLLADTDPLKQAGVGPVVEGVGEVMVLEDDTQRLELYHVQDLGHTDGMLVAYLPTSKILFQADFTLPQPGAEPNEFVRTLGDNVQRWDLDFERYYAVHDAGVPQFRADFDRALGLID